MWVVGLIWVGALLALVPAISTSSGPTIAACLFLLVIAPAVMLVLLFCLAMANRRHP